MVLCLVVLFVFILCRVCSRTPVPLDCPFLISPSVFYNDYCREQDFYFLPFNILLYCKLNPLIACKSYFTIVGIRPQTLKGSIWPKGFFLLSLDDVNHRMILVCDQMKNKTYDIVGTFPKSNRKIVERGTILSYYLAFQYFDIERT